MSRIDILKYASPSVKIAVSWATWATICLTGYYFARNWAAQKRTETLKVKQTFNDEFEEKLRQARLRLEHQENELKIK